MFNNYSETLTRTQAENSMPVKARHDIILFIQYGGVRDVTVGRRLSVGVVPGVLTQPANLH